ncbi:MAG: hypothetical protein PF636_01665 [Actinomycetota bacterium]|nr:hypothetical protein [Actinomycetota bacterium]
MKRFAVLAFAVALIATMALPAAAVAAKGGNGNGGSSGNSNGNRNAKSTTEAGIAVAPGQARKSVDASVEASCALDWQAARKAYRDQSRIERAQRSSEASGAAKARGRENATERQQANLERAATKMAEGKRKQMPPGLVQTWMRFMGGLGFEVDMADVPGAISATDTVEPDDTVDGPVELEDPVDE